MVWEKTLYIACIVAMPLATCGHTQAPAQLAPESNAQLATQPNLQPTEDELHAMSQLAGVIFAGQVVAVRSHDGVAGATGVVEVDFAVEDAVRGVSSGIYTLREWAGLWPAGELPFRLGMRYLMLLHATGPGGLSSPIGGADGAIPIRGGDSVPGQAAGTSPVSVATARFAQSDDRTVDLRWIATRVVRPLVYAPPSPAQSTARPVTVRAQVSLGQAATSEASPSTQPATAAETVPPAPQSLSYASALALLRSWESDAAR